MQLSRPQSKNENGEHEGEEKSWSAYWRQYALWQAFMRAALGDDPQDMPNLAYIMRDIAAYDAQGQRIAIQDNQGNIQENALKNAAVIVTAINAVQTRYVPAEHTDESTDKLAFDDFQTNLESDNNDVLVEALSERSKAAVALAQQAAAMGWQTVDTSDTANLDERYLLELACQKAGIQPAHSLDTKYTRIDCEDLKKALNMEWTQFQQDILNAYNRIHFPSTMQQLSPSDATGVPAHIKAG